MIECVIIGTSHEVQDTPRTGQCMQSTIERYAIRLIAEEYPFDTQSTAFGVAVRRHIPYLQIDMFGDEQRTAGIYEELRKRDNLPKTYDVQYRLSHADGVREDFWLDKIKASLEQGHVLIICGYLHVNFLAEKAESRGLGGD